MMNVCCILFSSLLEILCSVLYDSLRPVIIHMNHMETLTELCTILKVHFLIQVIVRPCRRFSTNGSIVGSTVRSSFSLHIPIQVEMIEDHVQQKGEWLQLSLLPFGWKKVLDVCMLVRAKSSFLCRFIKHSGRDQVRISNQIHSSFQVKS